MPVHMAAAERSRAIIWGASEHATVVEECAHASGAYEVVGFIDGNHPERKGRLLSGIPILGGVEALDEARALAVSHVLLGVGKNADRLKVADAAEAAGFMLGTLVHPSASVARTAVTEPGAFVAAAAVVGPYTTVGRGALINTSASVDHDCRIGEAAHVAPGVVLAGRVEVGKLAWVGIGAVVIDGVRIGEGALIGAGALVLRDVASDVVAYGVPAKPRR
jgi:UDP-perosamine 4-acetyltransferase